MAIELLAKPQFDILVEYAVPKSTSQIYTKLNNHHGDQFGKCAITGASPLKVAKIRLHRPIKERTVTFAIWSERRTLNIWHAQEGKTKLKGLAMLLVDAEELPIYIQRQIV